MNKVTINDVAREANVHKMTVSRALRGLPSVSVETRQRILDSAKRLGYRPNPLVSALMTQVRQGRVLNQAAPLALLYEQGARPHFKEHPIRRELVKGIQNEAELLNLKLDTHEYRKDPAWNARLEDILYARGIASAVVLAPITPFLEVNLRFPKLALIGIGNRLRKPWLNRVGTDHLGNVEIVFEKLLSEGRKRIGYVSDLQIERHSFQARLNAVRFFKQRDLPPEDHIPTYFYESPKLAGFKKWMRDHRPDAILLMGLHLPSMQRIAEVIDDPEKMIFLAMSHECEGFTGIIEANLEIGAMAVRLALHAAAVGLSGIPANRCSSLLTGTYHRADESCQSDLTQMGRFAAEHDVI